MISLRASRKSLEALLTMACVAFTSLAASAAQTDRTMRVRVELRPDVQVTRQQVTLGEVANLSSEDLGVLRRLMALPLGTVPRSGDPVALEREPLLQWILRRTGIETRQIEWQGQASGSVRLAVAILPGEQVASVARQHLQAHLASAQLRADIELMQVPRDVSVPGGRVTLRPRALGAPGEASAWSGASLSRRQTVWTDVWVDERFARTVAASFEVSVFAPALVATEDLPVGRVIDPARPTQSRLQMQEIDWSGRHSAPVGALVSELPPDGSLRLRRRLTAGQVLTRADVEAAPLIARGEYATLRTTQGPISLESRVEVLQDGGAGQSVRVKLPNAPSSITARVVAPGLVEVRQ